MLFQIFRQDLWTWTSHCLRKHANNATNCEKTAHWIYKSENYRTRNGNEGSEKFPQMVTKIYIQHRQFSSTDIAFNVPIMPRAIIHEQSLKKRRNSYRNLLSMTIDHESQTTNRKIRIHNVVRGSSEMCSMFRATNVKLIIPLIVRETACVRFRAG